MNELTLNEIAHGLYHFSEKIKKKGSPDGSAYFVPIKRTPQSLPRGLNVNFVDRAIRESAIEPIALDQGFRAVVVEGGFGYWSDHDVTTLDEKIGFIKEAISSIGEHREHVKSFGRT